MKQFTTLFTAFLLFAAASAFGFGNSIERYWGGTPIFPPQTKAEYDQQVEICREAREDLCTPNDCAAISVKGCPYDNFEPPSWESISSN